MIDADEPACWSWPVTPEDLDNAKECAQRAGHILLWNWQHGACAVCGRIGRLQRDHDHESRLMRGLLCQSCNSLEGFTAVAVPGYTTMYHRPGDQGRTFDRWHAKQENQMVVEVMRRYRLVNPATRLALRLRHTVAVSGRPLPRAYEGAVPIG